MQRAYNSQVGLCLVDLLLHQAVLVPVGYKWRIRSQEVQITVKCFGGKDLHFDVSSYLFIFLI